MALPLVIGCGCYGDSVEEDRVGRVERVNCDDTVKCYQIKSFGHACLDLLNLAQVLKHP